MKLIRYILFFFLIFFLTGCNPEIIDVKVSTKEIKKSISGETVSVSFSSSINILANINDIKGELSKIETIAEEYFDLEEFDITENDFGVDLYIEGDLPLIYTKYDSLNNMKSPWVIKIEDNNNQGSLKNFSYILSLNTTPSYGSFNSSISDINILANINKYQPIKLRLKVSGDDDLNIFTGGVMIDGESFVIMERKVQKKVTLIMKDGVYSKTFPKIFFTVK